MPYMIKCDGCFREMDEQKESIYYQGKERREKFCAQCNKRFSLFEELRKPVYEKYDALKKEDLKEMRHRIFIEGINPKTGETLRKINTPPPQITTRIVNTVKENLGG